MRSNLIFSILCVSVLFCACSSQKTPPPPPDETPVQEIYPTSTFYPTQTAYPTQTPLPTPLPMPVDISSAQPLPSDSLDWGLTYHQDGYSPLVTWWDGDELRSWIRSARPDGMVAFESEIHCSSLPYPEDVINSMYAETRLLADQPKFGKSSNTYYWSGDLESYSVYFLLENCYMTVFTQGISGTEQIQQMVRMIEEKLPQTTMENGLAFPSYTVNPQSFTETIMFVDQKINPNSARFEVKLSTKKPFIRILTLAIYDKTEDKFLSRTDYHNHSFLSPESVTLNKDIFANPSHQYQLWAWVEDTLVYIGDFTRE